MASTSSFVDYYVILGASIDAPWAELKVAYLRQALVLHPDKNPDPNATAMFQLVSNLELNVNFRIRPELIIPYLVEPSLGSSQRQRQQNELRQDLHPENEIPPLFPTTRDYRSPNGRTSQAACRPHKGLRS